MVAANPFEELKIILVSNGQRFDTVVASETTREEVADDLSLPPAVSSLYSTGPADGTTIPWTVEDARVFSITELRDAQRGYGRVGPDDAPSAEWPVDWIVVGSVRADPFVVDIADPEGRVLFARHGEGSWNGIEIASSFSAFVTSLVSFERVLVEDFALDVFDENYVLRVDFVQALAAALSGQLSRDQAASFVDFVTT